MTALAVAKSIVADAGGTRNTDPGAACGCDGTEPEFVIARFDCGLCRCVCCCAIAWAGRGAEKEAAVLGATVLLDESEAPNTREDKLLRENMAIGDAATSADHATVS